METIKRGNKLSAANAFYKRMYNKSCFKKKKIWKTIHKRDNKISAAGAFHEECTTNNGALWNNPFCGDNNKRGNKYRQSALFINNVQSNYVLWKHSFYENHKRDDKISAAGAFYKI